MNAQIRVSPVRVIDQDQNQLGVISVSEAMSLAREAGLDLVEVSPTERPPVCRIMDYGKFKYERKKRLKVASHSHVVLLKEIRLRPKTDTHDRMIKLNRAKAFLAEGHKVQFTMLFRGRERAHRDRAERIFTDIISEFGDTVKVERHALLQGRRMTMVVAPTKQATKQATQQVTKPTTKQATPRQPKEPAETQEATQPQPKESASTQEG